MPIPPQLLRRQQDIEPSREELARRQQAAYIQTINPQATPQGAYRLAGMQEQPLQPAFNPVTDFILGATFPGTVPARLASGAGNVLLGGAAEYATERYGPIAGTLAPVATAAGASRLVKAATSPRGREILQQLAGEAKEILKSERGSISVKLKTDPSGIPEHIFEYEQAVEPKQLAEAIKTYAKEKGEKVPGVAAVGKRGTMYEPSYNRDVRRLSALYETSGGNINLNHLEQAFNASLTRDPQTGKTIFDEIKENVDRFISVTGAAAKKGFRADTIDLMKQYKNAKLVNRKAGNAYITLDTVRGCPNKCPECFVMAKFMKAGPTGIDTTKPAAITLKGNVNDIPDKNMVFRLGASGEPSYNPITNSFNWEWTVSQLHNVGFSDPEAAKRLFTITKLNTLQGFDPTVLRNLQVSVDPLTPEHFFQSLRNIDLLRETYPDVNIAMRIRSINTLSDEINALQKIAVEFAKSRNIPVLETRLRMKISQPLTKEERGLRSSSTARIAPEYLRQGFELKDVSYFPKGREAPQISKEISPLSKFGIPDNMHYICNQFNLGGEACETCRLCQTLARRPRGKK